MQSKETIQKQNIQGRQSFKESIREDRDKVGRRVASGVGILLGIEMMFNHPDIYKPLEMLPPTALLASVMAALAFHKNVLEQEREEKRAQSILVNKPENIIFQGEEYGLLVATRFMSEKQNVSKSSLKKMISKGDLSVIAKSPRIK